LLNIFFYLLITLVAMPETPNLTTEKPCLSWSAFKRVFLVTRDTDFRRRMNICYPGEALCSGRRARAGTPAEPCFV
jgi:hypothetical protein